MNETEQLLDHFARTEEISLPAMRMSLRACLHSQSSLGQVILEKNRIFFLLTGGIVWPDAMLREVWAEIYSRSSHDWSESRSDLIALLRQCAQGNAAAQDCCRSAAITLWRERPKFLRRVLEVSVLTLEFDGLAGLGEPENLHFARSLYGLDAAESRVLEVAALSSTRSDFRHFLKNFPISGRRETWNVLSAMTCIPVKELQVALAPSGKLVRSGLVHVDVLPDTLEELVQLGRVGMQLFLLQADSAVELRDRMLVSLPSTHRCINDFVDQREEIAWIASCLRNARSAARGGVHVLIHGPSGTGKSELAGLLLKEAGLNGFNVQHLARNGLSAIDLDERIERVYWAEALLCTHTTSALVVEHVEEIALAERALLIEALERVCIPIIWICDDASILGPSVLNRFVYHFELKAQRSAARMEMVARLLEPVGSDNRLAQAIARHTIHTPAQIGMAAKFATIVSSTAAHPPEAPLVSALRAGNRALGKLPSFNMDEARDVDWDINALCVQASAPLSKILTALQHAPGASLAFHGVPGTGKTSLARHIAQTLNRPLLTKRVSDLSSKWLGETEQSIACMFHEAADQSAVLLLDEGDSFLRDRKLAKSSWEITQVNELLQQMESFKGIFICATNLMDDIDTAALRRFTFKIQFLPLDISQRTQMFARFVTGDPMSELRADIAQRLAKLNQLAPGDFATVRRQELVLNERFDANTWINELEREHVLRQPYTKHQLGFV